MRGFHKFGALIFLFALLAPATVQLLSREERISSGEKRALEPLPSFPRSWSDWSAFPRTVDGFLRDHFGLRTHLVKGWKLLNYYAFMYDAQARVTIGKDGWLYYSQFWKSKYAARECQPLSEGAKSFADRLDRLAARTDAAGIQLVFAIAPDKETIYPEYAPARLAGGAYCDVVGDITHALEGGRVKLIDLRASLLAWKVKEQVYFKTDSHWNDSGFLRVSRTLLESACPSRRACVALPLPIWSEKTYSGDLAELLGVGSALSEPRVGAEFPGLKYVRTVLDRAPGRPALSTEQWVKGEGTGRTLYVVGDSFAQRALRYLIADESVGKVTWVYYGQGRIDFLPIVDARPDAILIVIVERSFYDPSLLGSFAADLSK